MNLWPPSLSHSDTGRSLHKPRKFLPIMNVCDLFPELQHQQSPPQAPTLPTQLLPTTGAASSRPDPPRGLTFSNVVQNRSSWTHPGPAIEPVRKGMHLSIPINPDFYSARVSDCSRFSLIGRIILPKGSTPWKLFELKENLMKLWEIHNWSMLAIGQGYYVFRFAQEPDRDRILARSSWKLSVGPRRD